MKKINAKGFTLVELLIASAIFSVILLLIAFGVVQMGRIYYKGTITSKTQETARSIIDDVSRALQFNGGQFTPNKAGGYYCIGNRRYTFVLNQQVKNAQHGLISDTSPGNSCTPQNLAAPDADDEEMIGNLMRLNDLDISLVPGADNLYTVRVRVVYGDDDVLTSDFSGCQDDGTISMYCATADLTTTVKKRLP